MGCSRGVLTWSYSDPSTHSIYSVYFLRPDRSEAERSEGVVAIERYQTIQMVLILPSTRSAHPTRTVQLLPSTRFPESVAESGIERYPSAPLRSGRGEGRMRKRAVGTTSGFGCRLWCRSEFVDQDLRLCSSSSPSRCLLAVESSSRHRRPAPARL